MDHDLLEPWMLAADWRAEERAFVVVDLACWPKDRALSPLPPVPVIAIGDLGHPRATEADVLVGPEVSLAAITTAITATPRAAAVVVDLLRATAGLAPESALTLESFALGTLQAGEEHRRWLAQRPLPRPAPLGRVDVQRQDDILHVTIDRPAARNAVDQRLRDDLFEAFSLAELDPDIRSVRLRATGPGFGVGADLSEFGTTRDPPTAHAIRRRTLPARAMLARAAIYDVHVRGACIGSSLELAAFAGRFTASSDAWFQLPELGMGILPGAGGSVSIPARIGRQRAALMMLSGKRIRAPTALRWGLIDAIVDDLPIDEGRSDQIG